MILKPTQRSALERGLAMAKAVEERLRFMEEISRVSPNYQERTQQMRERQRYLITLAETGLVADASTR